MCNFNSGSLWWIIILIVLFCVLCNNDCERGVGLNNCACC